MMNTLHTLEKEIEKLHQSSNGHEVCLERIAHVIMESHQIRINESRFQIVELEAYYHVPQHPDPYLYRVASPHAYNKSQEHLLKWCFHPSGIDITIGDGKGKMGGFLIRGIVSLGEGEDTYIEGPRNTEYRLFEELFSVREGIPLILEEVKEKFTVVLKKGKRVGLKVVDSDTMFIEKEYRYVNTHTYTPKKENKNLK